MSALEVIALDTATPQLRAPGAGDTYTFPRAVEMPLGTANGVLYLNGSKVATSGSGLTYSGGVLFNTGSFAPTDGTNIAEIKINAATLDFNTSSASVPQVFRLGSSEQMRLTSTGLGIGTTSPSRRFEVWGAPLGVGGAGSGVLAVIANNSTAYNASPTAAISLWTKYNSAGAAFPVGVLQAGKENATDGNFAGFLSFITTDAVGAATERMRLDSSGNLGIGTTLPSGQLSLGVNGSTQVGSQFLLYDAGSASNTNNYGFAVNPSTGEFSASAGTSGYFTFYTTNRTEKMRLDTSGNLGLGVTPSLGKLHVLQSSGTAVYATTAGGTGYGGAFWNTDGGTNKFVQCAGAGANGVFSAGVGASTYMLLDTSGNLGLGVTPSGWATGATAIQFDSYSALFESVVGRTSLAFNTRESASGSYNYLQAEFASMYQQVSGKHEWFIAPSGNAGDPISFTQAMTLDASGRLGVGATSPAEKLDVYGGASGTVTNAQVGNAATAFLLGVDSSNNCQLRTAQSVNMLFYTAATERARIPSAGGMVVGTAAIATTATDGFLYVPTCAGTPTGTPTTQTGTAPIVIDTTNHKLYFYSGGTWRDAGP
jgi:hypothetical protein